MTPGTGATYLALLLLSAAVGAFMTYRGYVAGDARGAVEFTVLSAALTLWSLGVAAGLVAEGTAALTAARRLTFVAIATVPVALLALSLRYTGHDSWLTRETVAALSIVPVMTLLLLVTNPFHGLVWHVAGTDSVGAFSILVTHSGPWYWVHVSYSYALLVVASTVFVRRALRSPAAYREQSALILLGIAVPWVANVANLFGPWEFAVDPTPIFFTISGACIGIAVLRYQFLDLVPVARNNVVEVMREAVLVVDRKGRVVDVNPAAASMLGVAKRDAVGESVEAVAPDPIAAAATDGDADRTVTLSRGGQEKHFALRTSPLRGGGRVLLLHDVSEQRAQAEQLARQNERLEEFASVLSHDLRNPLNVAEGYLDLLTEETDSPYAEKAESALGRMDALIEDALNLAREGQAVVDPEPVALDAVAREAWETVPTGDATLSVETDAVVLGDPARVARVFENLFRNSAVHAGATADASADEGGTPGTDAGDSLSIRVVSTPDGFAVEDDGPGIPEPEREDVLEFGYSTDESGTGLGLAIVAEIADAHGWDVDIGESESGGARVAFHGVSRATAEAP